MHCLGLFFENRLHICFEIVEFSDPGTVFFFAVYKHQQRGRLFDFFLQREAFGQNYLEKKVLLNIGTCHIGREVLASALAAC